MIRVQISISFPFIVKSCHFALSALPEHIGTSLSHTYTTVEVGLPHFSFLRERIKGIDVDVLADKHSYSMWHIFICLYTYIYVYVYLYTLINKPMHCTQIHCNMAPACNSFKNKPFVLIEFTSTSCS